MSADNVPKDLRELGITEEEEAAGLRRLFDLRIELPIPADRTRLVAGYIARIEAERDTHIRALSQAILTGQQQYAALESELAALREANKDLMRRIGTVEMKEHLQTIDERDAAEDALSQAYFLIKGESSQWSNLFGHQEALQDIDDAQGCLRAEIVSLETANARLAAAVSDEEWEKFRETRWYFRSIPTINTDGMRSIVDALIRARQAGEMT